MANVATPGRGPLRGWMLLLLSSLFAVAADAQGKGDEQLPDVFDMSLEELKEVKIVGPAAITKLAPDETPASITVITADDIRHTPARNIYDLIEVYVPGAIWMNHELGPHPGVRGSIVDRNYKFVLRLDGRVMNSKAHYGAKSELEQWDLGDIERIEIVRGPGSVTYGPGAVAGVINILTRGAGSFEEDKIVMRFNDKYDSRGLTITHGYESERVSMFTFGSVTRTPGFNARQFLVTAGNEGGFIGEDILAGEVPMEYFADFQDKPQIKLHMALEIADRWKVWLRYTQEGSTWRGNEVKTDFGGELRNQQSTQDRQWTATLEYERELRDNLTLTTMLSADSFDAERREGSVRHPRPDHALNKKSSFSETELFVRGQLSWQASDHTEVAFGAEVSWDRYGPGWGDGEEDMRLGENGFIVSGPDSNAIDPSSGGSADRDGTALFAGDGWTTSTYSFFSEANLKVRPWLKILLSGRADRSTYSDWLVSPRIALIARLADRHVLKLVGQESRRFNTAGQDFTDVRNGRDPDSESLIGLELIYSASVDDRLSFDLAGFWNDVEVIAFDPDVNATTPVGNLRLYGLEAEIGFKGSRGRAGANYSFVKQLDWDLAPGVTRNGISYADYDLPLRGSNAVLQGIGNDLNNWPNQSFKIFGRLTLSKRMTIHADARIQWDFQGREDSLEGLRLAVAGEPEQADVERAIRRVREVDAFEPDFRANASFSYELRDNLGLRISVQNLLGANGNKRYSYDEGENRAAPRRVRFVEEPRALEIRVEYRF